MKTRRLWDVREFARENIPDVVGTIDWFPFSANHGIRVLDMPVYMPDQGWRLPREHWQFAQVIAKAAAYEERINPNTLNEFCYITIDQKPVPPMASQRRPGCHSDAFIVDAFGRQLDVTTEHQRHFPTGYVDRTYICYDDLPTEFFPGPFALSESMDCEAVLQNFDAVAATQHCVTFPICTLLCLDPYDVHRASINSTSKVIYRTFIKIAFSPHRYNRAGNTHNDLFSYEWEMIERGPGRNHRHAEVHS